MIYIGWHLSVTLIYRPDSYEIVTGEAGLTCPVVLVGV